MPESRPLSEPTLELLRQAIQQRRQTPTLGDDDLHAALHVVAAEAREHSLRPEALIVALKQVIDEAPPNRAGGGEDRRLREWMVTTCIRAYFEGT